MCNVTQCGLVSKGAADARYRSSGAQVCTVTIPVS